jgi:hypothetical protein
MPTHIFVEGSKVMHQRNAPERIIGMPYPVSWQRCPHTPISLSQINVARFFAGQPDRRDVSLKSVRRMAEIASRAALQGAGKNTPGPGKRMQIRNPVTVRFSNDHFKLMCTALCCPPCAMAAPWHPENHHD